MSVNQRSTNSTCSSFSILHHRPPRLRVAIVARSWSRSAPSHPPPGNGKAPDAESARGLVASPTGGSLPWSVDDRGGEARRRRLGLAPATAGWFVVNAADARLARPRRVRSRCLFEADARIVRDRPGARAAAVRPARRRSSPSLEPGRPSRSLPRRVERRRTSSSLAGSCSRPSWRGRSGHCGPWDFVHCPPGTAHVFVATRRRAVRPAHGRRATRRRRDVRVPRARRLSAGRRGGAGDDVAARRSGRGTRHWRPRPPGPADRA